MLLLIRMNKVWRTASVLFFVLFLSSAVYLFYTEVRSPQWLRFRFRAQNDMDPELLPDAPSPDMRNIFFVESSCALLDVPSESPRLNLTTEFGGLQMTARTACALEAAATTHPERPVYLVHTCPLDFKKMWDTAPKYALEALSIPNVRVWPVRMSELFAGTSSAILLARENLGTSSLPVEYASDILRLYLLWQFGGTYLDSDVLMLRSLGEMQNFACVNDDESVNNAVLDFARDETGKEVATACVRELASYRPEESVRNGPHPISRVLGRRCRTTQFTRNVAPKICGGFRVLPISDFYPVHWKKWEDFFREEGAGETMKAIKRSIGVHVWNAAGPKETNISLSSKTPYAQIVHRVCPGVISTVGSTF